jgi:pimeloyl-ACP methyl ester carboxylesterase
MRIDVNGFAMEYDVIGEGRPLLWLHGATGSRGDWRHLFETPPPGYAVIAPDLRGHGGSTNPAGEFSFRQCARDVQALLDHLGIDRVDAIGLSGGGIVLLHLARSAPQLVKSMVLVSAPPYFPTEARRLMRAFSPEVVGEAEMDRMRRVHTRPGQIEHLFAMCRGFADSYDDVSFTPPQLSTIDAKTLIVFGDRDPLYPVSLALEMYAALPHAALWVVPGGGHAPVFGAAAKHFTDTALQFLGA